MAHEQVARVEAALEGLEALKDPAARELAFDAVEAVVRMYGVAVGRIAERLDQAQPTLLRSLARDELIAHLLMLHDAHPAPVEARVRDALDEVRPYLRSHGGDVDLLAIEGGVARIELRGSCDGCPSSSATLRTYVEQAVLKAAPDLDRVEAWAEVAGASEAGRRSEAARSSAGGARPHAAESNVPLPNVAPGALVQLRQAPERVR